ncbi:MAG TPA: S1 RNA-binding domain-containing protein [Candidatus Krumholzibacteria bacterium]|nr:S1 RNA-binding domain-containing protein [Candidatus Krumholzibacteria bacterium]HPD71169.1 S1 RNA-binding domain-containing protein [Candidatus Krumholzibacteria bacterium]HRY39131.1 S1 RNA-binding domain-containing protein [Candidatus Krumholzibacteria bacterium]
MHDQPASQDFADDDTPQESAEFAELLAASEASRPDPKPGDRVTGTVVQITATEVFVDVGARHELPMSLDDFRGPDGALLCQEGQSVSAYVIKTTDGLGLAKTVHPGDAGKRALQALQAAQAANAPVEGKITSTNKGGFTVDLGGQRGFCPFSQMDLRRIQDPEPFVGTSQRFLILEISADGRNIVLSRRALLQREREEKAASIRQSLAVGAIFTGQVTRLMPYGAFVDIGGVEGLVHISQICHQRISDPAEILREGQEVRVEVVEIQHPGENRRERVSLSMKSLATDPWPAEAAAIPVGQDTQGTITRLVDFGAFVLLKQGIEGLVHISELADRRLVHPREVVKEGDEITVRVLEIDPHRRRISLSRRQAGDYAGD